MKKPTIGQWVGRVLSLLPPMLYLAMYLPIWKGKQLYLTGDSLLVIALFVLQCAALISSLTGFIFLLRKKESSGTLSVISFLLTFASVLFLCFVGFFFVLELCGVPWFLAQQ